MINLMTKESPTSFVPKTPFYKGYYPNLGYYTLSIPSILKF